MSAELRFDDVKLGDKIGNRYVLKSVTNPDNGEAATFMCDYDGWICAAKIFYDDRMPSKEILDKQRKISSSHIIKKMDQTIYNNHLCQIMPNFEKNIMSKPVNDKIILEMIIPGVLDALKAIHSVGIIHGFVKPTNIFYNPLGDDVLLGDFGVDISHIEDCGKEISMNYLPPEVGRGIYDSKADYYSLGVSLVQLITGKNPFEGMNKRKMVTTASTIEFSLPPMVSPMLRTIIEGLTVKDYDTRWGAEELEKALAGEEVEVVDNFVYVPPENSFTFNGEKYKDLKSLADAFADNWNDAIEAINTPEFLEFVEISDDSLLETIKEILNEEPNNALYRLLYFADPELPFCWKGLKAESLEAFADAMKRTDDKEPYKTALADGALLAFEQFKGADESAVSKVTELTNDAAKGEDASVLAFKLDYMLSGQLVYLMDGIPFADINTFTSYIQMNVGELKEICHEFINDPRFFAWIEVLGYGEQLAKWRAEN